jgi:hypothetical protein
VSHPSREQWTLNPGSEEATGQVSAAAIDGRDRPGERPLPERLRTVFFLRSSEGGPVFGGLLREMLSDGHEVVLALEPHRKGRRTAMFDVFEDLSEHYPRFAHRQIQPRRDPWRIPAGAIQRSLDYLGVLEAQDPDAELQNRAREHSPRLLRGLLKLPPFRWRSGRRVLGWLLRRLETGIPLPRDVRSLIKDQAADVVIVSALAELDSPRGEFIRTAEAARVPSVLVATSWGDVPSERALRDLPTAALVSAGEQTTQAPQLQGLPSERIETVGAQRLNGSTGLVPTETVEEIQRVASAQVTTRREGRLLRPILWLLTPLLVILLPLLRPRATFRDVTRFFRGLRKRGTQRRRARAKAASAQRQTEAKERKQMRAEEKRRRRLRQREAKERRKTTIEAKRPPRSDPGEVKPQVSPQEEAQDSEAPGEQAKAGAEPTSEAERAPR